MKHNERYSMERYGDGTAPLPALVAIPDYSGRYFTQGKRYPVISHRAWVYVVRCDLGHERVIGMESGDTSAHLPGLLGGDPCGTFTIETA